MDCIKYNIVKKIVTCAVLVIVFNVTGCTKDPYGGNGSELPEEIISSEDLSSEPQRGSSSEPGEMPDVDEEILPTTGSELYNYIIDQWKLGDVSRLYFYASDSIKSLVTQEEFPRLFLNLNETFGNINSVKNEAIFLENDIDVYTATLIFDNVEADVEIYLDELVIEGYNADVRFVNPFDIEHEDGVVEHYFQLESDRYRLNAVYTYADKVVAPVVLLIPGSGQADYNESIGLLEPFKDIALMLAKQGINSLRFEKRTNRYAEEFTAQSGITEEYLDDCNAAIAWIKNRSETEKIYLLGHSLGAQIAVFLVESNDVEGLILLNGSARHFARIMEDQRNQADPYNSVAYKQLADMAVNMIDENVAGYNCFGLTDYYWAEYNKYNTVDILNESGVCTLIINSKADRQLFEADINLWQEEFGSDENVTIVVFDDISHYGYKDEALSMFSVYRESELANDMINDIAEFINK